MTLTSRKTAAAATLALAALATAPAFAQTANDPTPRNDTTMTRRAPDTDRGNNWGWLGLLGLVGLAGLRRRDREPGVIEDRRPTTTTATR
jgi:MYXO-CTERM domain-containing protein